MHIYRLYPVAGRGTSNWDIAANRGEVVVRARTTGDARLVAAEAEARSAGDGRHENDDVYSVRSSAFTDEKMYGVQRIETPQYAEDGDRMVLSGDLSVSFDDR
ncbi:hypothetical protein [Pelagibacterium xiamenense]|uniref:hypothetical protein n=1 Tax=Pelagibacterium xiamenense TaxID=2901140 RepID=UPI001E57D54A|nr:hypothetical protein [Pelagibacterium xiamenense]MCD7059802.1 hypothetical protein [Pelagibacterium xiamenense]